MRERYCKGIIVRNGMKFWGSPHEPPSCDPVPAEVLERCPDVVTNWDNCSECGEPMCGKVARFVLRDDEGWEVWLCAEHYDEQREETFPVWHECPRR